MTWGTMTLGHNAPGHSALGLNAPGAQWFRAQWFFGAQWPGAQWPGAQCHVPVSEVSVLESLWYVLVSWFKCFCFISSSYFFFVELLLLYISNNGYFLFVFRPIQVFLTDYIRDLSSYEIPNWGVISHFTHCIPYLANRKLVFWLASLGHVIWNM